MKEKSTETGAASSPTWEPLEAFARQSVQQFLQRVLGTEVDELLARARYERRAAVDGPVGYRNGYGKPRPKGLPTSSGLDGRVNQGFFMSRADSRASCFTFRLPFRHSARVFSSPALHLAFTSRASSRPG